LTMKDNQRIYEVYVENLLSYKIIQEESKTPPMISELARSDKISKTVQNQDIVLTSTSGLQIIVSQDKLLITETAKLSDEYETLGLCSISIRELSRSVPRDVLSAVFRLQKSSRFGPQSEEQIRKIDNLMVILNERVFPQEIQEKSNINQNSYLTKICILKASQNNEVAYLKPLNSEIVYPTRVATLLQKYPDYCQILKTDRISIMTKLTPEKREIKLSFENYNDVVKMVQLQGQLSGKLLVNDEERSSYENDDLTIQSSTGNTRFLITSDKFEVVIANDEDKSGVIKIKALAYLGSGSSECQRTPDELTRYQTQAQFDSNQ